MRRHNILLTLFSAAVALPLISAVNVGVNSSSNPKDDLPYIPGRLLVKSSHDSISTLAHTASSVGAKNIKTFSLVEGLNLYEFDAREDINSIKDAFLDNPGVEYAEPDYIYHAQSVNDPRYSAQWALENDGQNDGTIDADINAEAMWDIESGDKSVVIGVIDTGIDYTHPDLVGNMWHNPGEIAGNNRDDDGNGFVDDIHGINAINDSGDPMDDNVHGTHVAGTIGAEGNNELGVVGVAQSVQLAGCKFLSGSGSGGISDAVQCMEYFAELKSRSENPVNIVATNNSWGGGSRSRAMYDAILAHKELGILFIAAAGNEGNNNDHGDRYPCNYEVDNVIAVAATDKNDELASFSNYGKKKVHVAAPGVKILNTVLDHGYGSLSGTSMATPHVAGLAAIISSHQPDLDYLGIKNLIMSGGEQIAAAQDTTISGRRIRGADTDGVGSLTCDNQVLSVRNLPVESSAKLALGESIYLEALHINCADPAGAITLYQDDNEVVILSDDGENGDKQADDGVYSLLWQPALAGDYDLDFGDGDIVSVRVGEQAKPREYKVHTDIEFEYEYINGVKLKAKDESLHWIRSSFPIPFAGDDEGFVDFYVSSNGTISFSDRVQPGPNNQSLPNNVANTLIAPFWDDLTTTGKNGSDVYVDVIGDAPNRKLVVEWWRVRHYRSRGLGAFQVVFYENSPDVRFNYLDTYLSNRSYNYGRSATIGLQTSKESALEYSHNKRSVASKSSLLFKLE